MIVSSALLLLHGDILNDGISLMSIYRVTDFLELLQWNHCGNQKAMENLVGLTVTHMIYHKCRQRRRRKKVAL